jgi:hypothetical protein
VLALIAFLVLRRKKKGSSMRYSEASSAALASSTWDPTHRSYSKPELVGDHAHEIGTLNDSRPVFEMS